MKRRQFLRLALGCLRLLRAVNSIGPLPYGQVLARRRNYQFDGRISREVLDDYLSRSISMEGIFNGRGDLTDNSRMLRTMGVRYISGGASASGETKRIC